jgi:hypothetical protein
MLLNSKDDIMIKLITGALIAFGLIIASSTVNAHEYSYKHYHNSNDTWDTNGYNSNNPYYNRYYAQRDREYWDWYYADESAPTYNQPIIIDNAPYGYKRVSAYDSYCGCNISVLVPIR